LFEHLARLSPGRRLAWDCGTGNGQAATGIAEHFEQVIATDPSEAQLAESFPHTRVSYRLGRRNRAGFPTDRRTWSRRRRPLIGSTSPPSTERRAACFGPKG
jgi:hypothetical protein